MGDHHLKKVGWFVVAVIGVIVWGVLIRENVSAANTMNFQAGYIISDYQMTDYGSMSEGEIQNFLSARNRCNNRDYNYYLQLSRKSGYTWHFANGHFVCLSEERFGDGEVIGVGETAAHIIWQAARDYRINPKVLIVTLQKETGLVTDPIPNNADYRKAMGYGCPDSGGCSARYYGFKNQVRRAAELYRSVMDGGWTNYPVGNNYIQYNPNAACGGSVVNIRNRATSALYRYTPYQPNAGALASGYGTASCGAYGNRNFYSYYEDWFGGIVGEGKLPVPNSSPIVEDEYIIRSAMKYSSVIDLAGGSAANGANINLYSDNGTGAQRWRVVNNGDDTYSIINTSTGKAIDVAGGEMRDETNVQSYDKNGTCAQKWKIVRNEDQTVTFYSACSGRVLDVANGRTNDGANIQIYRPNGSVAQKWRLVPIPNLENGEYEIISGVSSRMALDVDAGGKRDGTNIQIYTKNGSAAQKWLVTYGSDGYYTIKNPVTGKVLDVYGGFVENATNVQLYGANGSCAQKWQIVKKGDGYGVYSLCSAKTLDVSGGKANDGANVQIYVDNGTMAQRWKFDYVYDLKEGNYIIESAINNKKVIDIAANGVVDGTNVQIYDSNNTVAQKWKIERREGGAYVFKNIITGKVLDVYGGFRDDGTNVQMYRENGTCAQKWIATEVDAGNYSFYSKCSGAALDVYGGCMANGSNIQIYKSNESGAQKWRARRY